MIVDTMNCISCFRKPNPCTRYSSSHHKPCFLSSQRLSTHINTYNFWCYKPQNMTCNSNLSQRYYTPYHNHGRERWDPLALNLAPAKKIKSLNNKEKHIRHQKNRIINVLNCHCTKLDIIYSHESRLNIWAYYIN